MAAAENLTVTCGTRWAQWSGLGSVPRSRMQLEGLLEMVAIRHWKGTPGRVFSFLSHPGERVKFSTFAWTRKGDVLPVKVGACSGFVTVLSILDFW